MIKRSEIEHEFLRFWRKGFGSVSVDDLVAIQELIQHFNPERFLEIGMASGISAGFIARFLDASDGRELTTIDHDNTFFGDPEKENGYLVESIYSGSKTTVKKKPFTTSMDIAKGDSLFDMAFIDANRQHPWPTIDMLMTIPRMNGPKVMIFDDFDLYKKQSPVIGIGPMILYDQFDIFEKCRPQRHNDLFYLGLSSVGLGRLVEVASQSLFCPWTIRTPLNEGQSKEICKLLQEFYGSHISRVFQICLQRFNSEQK